MARLVRELNGKSKSVPVLVMDIVSGLRPWVDRVAGKVHEKGAEWCQLYASEPIQFANPCEAVGCLIANAQAAETEGAVLFILNAHRILRDGQGWNPGFCQAVWNSRDVLETVGATLVLLAPALELPPDLQRDVVTITEELPGNEELGRVVDDLCYDSDTKKPEGDYRKRVLDCVRGLSAFEAKQVFSMALDRSAPTGVNMPALWLRKVRAIEATPGLTVYRGKETLDDVGGLANGKRLFRDTLEGAFDFACLVFCDEIDKGMSAAGSDSSGTTQDQAKTLLTYMQDNDVLGATELGPPGTGKSLLPKALSNTYNLPLIMLDLGALKSRYVGDSEANMRAAVKVIHSISGGKALFICACNRDPQLLPELRRRFSYQLLYVDLPDAEERAAAWQIHTQGLRFRGERYTLPPELNDWQAVSAEGWTGAEIKNCCLKAYAMKVKLSEAAKSIVPISKSAGAQIEEARRAASGRYISASAPGIYTYRDGQTIATGRRVNL